MYFFQNFIRSLPSLKTLGRVTANKQLIKGGLTTESNVPIDLQYIHKMSR